jgi:hypothetical protein
MFLLDTTVISELGRPFGKGNPRLGAWSASTPQAVPHLSVITILEIKMAFSASNTGTIMCRPHVAVGWGMSGSRSQAESSGLTGAIAEAGLKEAGGDYCLHG